ncbi:MAG: cysteine--tRNA ligase [Candidatus Dormibacteria bacterium]
MSQLRLHDTLSRGLKTVEPLEPGHVRLYTCGPTVYGPAHIGNFRAYVFEDVLRRWLEHRFPRVTHVMNLTDVEDKIIRNATARGHGLDAETAPHITAFHEDLAALGILPAQHYPRATAYIAEMLALIERLEGAGMTYRADGSVYFRIAAFPAYGRLSGAQARSLQTGASGRVDADEYGDKEDARDFALWKAVGPDEIGWDSPLGRGRPGWHIECSAMSMSLLGESFDIHCGGVDNIFPHHENEIAQSEGATGEPFVQIWCHNAHLRVEGDKMSKSLGNFVTLREALAAGAKPSAVRYALAAMAQYRQPVNYSAESLHAAGQAVERLAGLRRRLDEVDGAPAAAANAGPTTGGVDELTAAAEAAWAGFAVAMDDDLNLPRAMGVIFNLVTAVNRRLDIAAGSVTQASRRRVGEVLDGVDAVLGVFPLVERESGAVLDGDVQELLDARVAARGARDWARSDQLRDSLADLGILVEDTAQGQRFRRVGN